MHLVHLGEHTAMMDVDFVEGDKIGGLLDIRTR